jgi:hypothetical protein
LVLARAYLGLKDFEQVESNAKSAYEKAVGMKYRWAGIEAGSLPNLDPRLRHSMTVENILTVQGDFCKTTDNEAIESCFLSV